MSGATDRSASLIKRHAPRASSIPRRTAEPLPPCAWRRSRTRGSLRIHNSTRRTVASPLPSSTTTISQDNLRDSRYRDTRSRNASMQRSSFSVGTTTESTGRLSGDDTVVGKFVPSVMVNRCGERMLRSSGRPPSTFAVRPDPKPSATTSMSPVSSHDLIAGRCSRAVYHARASGHRRGCDRGHHRRWILQVSGRRRRVRRWPRWSSERPCAGAVTEQNTKLSADVWQRRRVNSPLCASKLDGTSERCPRRTQPVSRATREEDTPIERRVVGGQEFHVVDPRA